MDEEAAERRRATQYVTGTTRQRRGSATLAVTGAVFWGQASSIWFLRDLTSLNSEEVVVACASKAARVDATEVTRSKIDARFARVVDTLA